MARTYQGYFKPRNPDKYKGDPTNIIYRSSWELKLMMYLDSHKSVLKWASEEIIIPYISPIDGKVHRYFPDFVVTKINKDGKKETVLIEVKPFSQTRPPKKQKNITKKYITEVKTWGINEAKWKAANEYCKDRGWTFHIFTEKELGIK
jgi:murein tripeptide amidase MpaA